MVRRRDLIALLGGAAAAMPRAVFAQAPERMRRIGVLDWSSESDRVIYDGLIAALREIGYAEGRNIAVDYRGAGGDSRRAAQFAAELAGSRVDLIIAITTPAAHAARAATQTIPIVFHVADAMATGLVANLARPGGNMTGVSLVLPDIAAKWLELLREVMPDVARVAFVGSTQDPNARTQLRQVEASAARLGIAVQALLLGDAGEIDAAFAAAAESGASAVIVQPIWLNRRAEVAAIALRRRMPWISEPRVAAEAGALLTYGPNRSVLYGRFAASVDRVLRGADPGEIPVEQPTRFELVVNLRAARALGLTVPQTLLARADEVIE